MSRFAMVVIAVVLAAVPLDARGRFELVAPRGGPHRLVLRGPEDASGRLELREELDLEPGERAWQLALAPGRIEGSGALGRGTRERFTRMEAPVGERLEQTGRRRHDQGPARRRNSIAFSNRFSAPARMRCRLLRWVKVMNAAIATANAKKGPRIPSGIASAA